jgi:hypothetical protein
VKILKSFRKKRTQQMKAKIHIYYRRHYEIKITTAISGFERDIERLRTQMEDNRRNYESRCDNMSATFKTEIDNLHIFYKKEFDIVRDQEKSKWLPVVGERDTQIQKLQQRINDNEGLYYSLREREAELDALTKTIAIKFNAGNKLITKGVQSIETAVHTEIDSYNRKYLKSNVKILEALKERKD